jgi:hypothetical protein
MSSTAVAQTAPYIRTLPTSSFVYPGQQFKVFVEADNHNLNGHRTAYAQYTFDSPQALLYVADSAQVPETNDFFEGEQDMYESVGEPNEILGTFGFRFTFGNGVANRKGYLAQYEYVVPTDLTGTYTFELSEEGTSWNGSSEEPQERTLYSGSVTVADFGDASLDGHVDVADFKLLTSHWMQSDLNVATSWLSGDFTFDGAVNTDDLGMLALNWNDPGNTALPLFQTLDPNFTSNAVPEPATLSMLLVSALLIRRVRC